MYCECPELKKLLTKTSYCIGNAIQKLVEAQNASPTKACILLEEARDFIDDQLAQSGGGTKSKTKSRTPRRHATNGAAGAAKTTAGTTPKKRGRPPGSTKTSKSAKAQTAPTPIEDDDDDDTDVAV